MNNISIIISLIALTISGLTFWLTRLKKGVVKMTRPTVIFFGPDGGGEKGNKLFIRTLLYSTSDIGQYVQNMYISLQCGESIQNFNIWVYDDKGLVRGSGLFINKNGLACNHHFLLPNDAINYKFISGNYILQIFVETVNKNPEKIFEEKLNVTKEQEEKMLDKRSGLYFDWAPNTRNYSSHIKERALTTEEISSLLL